MHLKYYQDFRSTLQHYHMSDRAKAALEGLSLALLVAPTSTGRNTVIRHLVEKHNYYFIVSDTTRAPQYRDGKMEESGVNYFFRSEEDILADLKAGEFLEAAIIHELQVSGISIRELERAKALNKVAVTDIEIVGTENVMRSKPDAKAIFLIPPSFEEWQQRLMRRGKMTPHEIRNRLMSAEKEFEAALKHQYYHFVITENVAQSAGIIDAIVNNKPNPHQDRGRELINQLQQQLKHKLEAATLF